MAKNIAIIPVRTGSKRLPNKNILDFSKANVYTYCVDAAIESELFDEVHVSTESQLVVDICSNYELKIKSPET